MKRNIAFLVALASVASACGGGAEETRNAVITPQVMGGNATGTFGWVGNLDHDSVAKTVYGGGWLSGIEEGLVLKGAGVVDTGNPANLSVPASFPEVNGQAETVHPDGKGGWYLAGYMERVGLLKNTHLVHVNADGNVDPAFDPRVSIKSNPWNRNEQVLLLTDHPADPGLLLMVARVTNAGDTSFAGVAADCARVIVIDKATGTVSDRIDLDGSCADSVVLYGRQLIIAGSFAVFKGKARNRIAGIDVITKSVTNVGINFGTAYPTFASDEGGQVVSQVAVDGDTLYVTGRLTKVGQPAAAVDLLTGLVSGWKPAELISAGVLNWQVKRVKMLVSKNHVVMAGCLGDITPNGFAAFDRSSGARTSWEPKISWEADPCPAGMTVFATGDTFLVQGEFTQVRGITAPNIVWLGSDAVMRPVQLPIAVRYFDGADPHAQVRSARFFPELKRMFLGVDRGRLMVNGRNMGPYLATDDTGVTKLTQIGWTLANQRMDAKFAADGALYVLSTPVDFDPAGLDPDAALAARRIIHRFDPATGKRDPGFEIDHTGLIAGRIVVGDSVIAVIGSSPADGGLGSHIWFHEKSSGRSIGLFPDEGTALRWPWPVVGATAKGDTLFTYGAVPDGAGMRTALSSIDMRTGTARLYNVDLGSEQACWCNPAVIGSHVFVPRFEPRRPSFWRAVDIESGATVRDMTEWSMGTELPPVKVGSRIVGPAPSLTGLGFVAVDAETLEPSGTFATGVLFTMVSAVLGTPERMYLWQADPVRQADGTVLTGLVALDTEGKPTMMSVQDPAVSTEVMPQEPVAAPVVPEGLTGPIENPAETGDRRAAEVAAGRISVVTVNAGNRSLTVRFEANGNEGPYDVRQAGGKKICTTTGSTCTFTNLTAHSSYSFTVESRGKADESRSQPSSAAKPIVLLKKGKTLKLSTVLKPASKRAVKWKSSKACTLDARKGTLKAPKKGAVCSVTVTSRAKGKAAVTRSITVLVG